MRTNRHDYEGDVFYEAWRRGLNPDDAVRCAYDCYDADRTPTECVSEYAEKRERARAEAEQAQEEDIEPEQPR